MVVSVCYLHVLCVGRRSSDSQDERPKSRIKTTQIIFVYKTKNRKETKMKWKQTKKLLLDIRPPRAGHLECFLYLFIFQFPLSFFIFKVYFDLRAKKRREMKGWVYRESGKTWWTVFDTWPNRYPTCLYTKFRERQISIGAKQHYQKQKANHPKSLSPIRKKGMKKIQFLHNTVAVSLFFSLFSIYFSI